MSENCCTYDVNYHQQGFPGGSMCRTEIVFTNRSALHPTFHSWGLLSSPNHLVFFHLHTSFRQSLNSMESLIPYLHFSISRAHMLCHTILQSPVIICHLFSFLFFHFPLLLRLLLRLSATALRTYHSQCSCFPLIG